MKRIIRVLMNVIYRIDIFHQMLNKIILVKRIIFYLSCLYLCTQILIIQRITLFNKKRKT